MAVVSSCSGGRVLRWSVDGAESKLTLTAGFALVRKQLPLSRSASRVSVIDNHDKWIIMVRDVSLSVCMGSNCRVGHFHSGADDTDAVFIFLIKKESHFFFHFNHWLVKWLI